MKLNIQIEQMKDKTGIEKRVMFTTLTTDIPGMERIDAVAELDNCPLSDEIAVLITDLLSAKQVELQKKSKKVAQKKKKVV